MRGRAATPPGGFRAARLLAPAFACALLVLSDAAPADGLASPGAPRWSEAGTELFDLRPDCDLPAEAAPGSHASLLMGRFPGPDQSVAESAGGTHLGSWSSAEDARRSGGLFSATALSEHSRPRPPRRAESSLGLLDDVPRRCQARRQSGQSPPVV